MKQLNLNEPRVRAWYDACERHSERCSSDRDCPGCERLLRCNAALRAVPGLLVEVSA